MKDMDGTEDKKNQTESGGGILAFLKEEKWEILKLVMLIAGVALEMKAEKKKLTKKAWKAAAKEEKKQKKEARRLKKEARKKA